MGERPLPWEGVDATGVNINLPSESTSCREVYSKHIMFRVSCQRTHDIDFVFAVSAKHVARRSLLRRSFPIKACGFVFYVPVYIITGVVFAVSAMRLQSLSRRERE